MCDMIVSVSLKCCEDEIDEFHFMYPKLQHCRPEHTNVDPVPISDTVIRASSVAGKHGRLPSASNELKKGTVLFLEVGGIR